MTTGEEFIWCRPPPGIMEGHDIQVARFRTYVPGDTLTLSFRLVLKENLWELTVGLSNGGDVNGLNFFSRGGGDDPEKVAKALAAQVRHNICGPEAFSSWRAIPQEDRGSLSLRHRR